MLKDRVNIYLVEGYLITVGFALPIIAPVVDCSTTRLRLLLAGLVPSVFESAGTAEINGINRDIRANRVTLLIDWTRKIFPEIDTGHGIWVGLCQQSQPSLLQHKWP